MSRTPSVLTTPDGTRAAVAAQGGDGAMAPGGLTFGKLVDGGPVGKMKGEYRKVAGTATAFYKIPHGLGFVPAWCQLISCDNPGTPNTNLCASPTAYDKWTATEIQMRVDPVMGGVAGAVMWFMIGGER